MFSKSPAETIQLNRCSGEPQNLSTGRQLCSAPRRMRTRWQGRLCAVDLPESLKGCSGMSQKPYNGEVLIDPLPKPGVHPPPNSPLHS